MRNKVWFSNQKSYIQMRFYFVSFRLVEFLREIDLLLNLVMGIKCDPEIILTDSYFIEELGLIQDFIGLLLVI